MPYPEPPLGPAEREGMRWLLVVLLLALLGIVATGLTIFGLI